jgi:chitosanase
VDQKLRAERLTSLFENGVIELQYGYAENLHDGRGITCGFEGFCTGTGDAYLVVKQYTDLNPNNPLAKYLPELTRLLTASNPASTTGLSGFITNWATAANDPVFRQVQENVGDSQYYTPAMNYASEWGMTTSLSKAFIWDTMVMHGDGDLEELDSTPAIFDRTVKQMGGSPATGVDEKEFLVAFIAMRKADLLYSYDPESREVWKEAAQRCDVFTEIVNAGNWDLNGPIAITNREYGPITIP